MGQLSICLLGPPVVRHGERPVAFRTRKSLALLAYLAVDQRPHTREHLRTLLWPEHDAEHASALLRRTLAFLRQSLGEPAAAPVHLATGERITLLRGPTCSVDLDALAAAATRIAAPTAAGDLDTLVASAEHAVAGWRGAFLDDFTLADAPEFEAWLQAQRVSWQGRLEGVLDGLVRLLVASGQLGRALEHASRWADHLPTSELACRRLMETQLATGLPEQARLSLARLRSALAHELGVEPPPDLLALLEPGPHGQLGQLEPGPRRQVGQLGPRSGATAAAWAGPVPLVGREADLAAIARAFGEVAAGATRGVVLVGEAGIGKTALAQQVSTWAAAQGADVLAGAAFETGGRLSYGPVVEALRERLERENAPADLVDDVWLAALVHLLPELQERYPDLRPLPLLDEMAQARLFEAVARLLEALAAARGPLVLFLDDVQWSDTGTRELLLYLVRRWTRTGQPLLLLLTVRAEARATDPALQRWLRELRRVGGVAERTLGPVSRSDLQLLLDQVHAGQLGSDTGHAWADWLFAETGGQPFFVVETLRSLGEQRVLELTTDADGRWALQALPPAPDAAALGSLLPSSVRDLVQARLELLSEPARGLAAAGSVLGGRIHLDTLAHLVSLPDDVFIGALDELLRTALWVEVAPAARGRATPRYAFAHDRIRDVAYAALGLARRRHLHRKALEALQTVDAAPWDLARQAREADLPEPAFRYSVAAGDARLAVFAVADALAEYEQAHTVLAAQPDRIDAAAVLLPRLGRAYEVAHRLPEARAVFEEMRDLAHRAGAARLESQALTALGTLTMHERWDRHAAVALIGQAAGVAAASGETAAEAESEWSLAQILAYDHGREQAVEHATRAVALARQADDPDLLARSLNALAMAHLMLGQAEACAAAAQESRALFQAVGNELMRWDSQRLLAASHFQLGQARRALTIAREALDGCHRARNLWGQAWGAKEVVHALLDLGALDEAVGTARGAVDAARALDDPVALCMALTLLCRAYRRVGQVAQARTAALEALEIDASVSTRPLRESVLADLAACATGSGDWAAAAHYALEALERRDGTLYLDTGLTRWRETAALVRAGHLAAAEADLCAWAPRLAGCPRYRLPYLRGLAVVADAKGQPADADAYRTHAQALATAGGLAGELALARV